LLEGPKGPTGQQQVVRHELTLTGTHHLGRRQVSVTPGQVRSGQVRSHQVRSGQVRSGHTRTGHTRTGHTRSGQDRSHQVRSGQVTPGQVTPGQVRTGHTRTGHTRTGHTRSGQATPGHTRSGQAPHHHHHHHLHLPPPLLPAALLQTSTLQSRWLNQPAAAASHLWHSICHQPPVLGQGPAHCTALPNTGSSNGPSPCCPASKRVSSTQPVHTVAA
jgi:hypothetical protein